MKTELEQLRKSVEECKKPTVASMLKRILDYATRPVTEFNIYEGIELFETLQNIARDEKHDQREYYRLAYHTARSKLQLPKEHFRSLILQLLGDKNHQKVSEAVAKVDKSMAKTTSAERWSQPYARQSYGTVPWRTNRRIRCFSCNRFGHIAAKCLVRRSTLATQPSSKKNT